MRKFAIAFILIVAAVVGQANNFDTTMVRYNESTMLQYHGKKQMILIYRDVNGEKPSAFGYDIYFTEGKMDSMIYYEDSVRLKILYKRLEDNKWEMMFDKNDTYRYPNKYDRISSLSHVNVTGQTYYKFTMRYDTRAKAIQSIEQHISDYTDRQEGIVITFKNGKTRFINIISSSGRASPTIYFTRSGRIKKMYVRDYIDNNTGLSMYIRLKYSLGKLK